MALKDQGVVMGVVKAEHQVKVLAPRLGERRGSRSNIVQSVAKLVSEGTCVGGNGAC